MMYSVHETNFIKNKDGSKELDIVEMELGKRLWVSGCWLVDSIVLVREPLWVMHIYVFCTLFLIFFYFFLSENVDMRTVNTRCSFVLSYPTDVYMSIYYVNIVKVSFSFGMLCNKVASANRKSQNDVDDKNKTRMSAKVYSFFLFSFPFFFLFVLFSS